MSLSLLILASGCTKEYSPELSYLDDEQLMDLVKEADKPYVLLNFYNTTCKPCVKEIPELAELTDHPDEHVNVHFIALGEKEASNKDLTRFWKKLQIAPPIYCVNTESLNTFLKEHRQPNQSSTLPMSLIMSQNGRLVKKITSFTDAHEVHMIIHKDESFGI